MIDLTNLNQRPYLLLKPELKEPQQIVNLLLEYAKELSQEERQFTILSILHHTYNWKLISLRDLLSSQFFDKYRQYRIEIPNDKKCEEKLIELIHTKSKREPIPYNEPEDLHKDMMRPRGMQPGLLAEDLFDDFQNN